VATASVAALRAPIGGLAAELPTSTVSVPRQGRPVAQLKDTHLDGRPLVEPRERLDRRHATRINRHSERTTLTMARHFAAASVGEPGASCCYSCDLHRNCRLALAVAWCCRLHRD